MTGCRVGRVDLQKREIVHLVRADDIGLVSALVAELDFDAAIGAFYNMEVGEHVAGFIEDEAGALTLLRHISVKEVVHHGARRDVDNRGQDSPIDSDVVLLFSVKCGRSLGLGQFEWASLRRWRR